MCCDKLPDGTFTYTLCDVRTCKPYPGDPREKINYTPKAKVSAPAKVSKGKLEWQPRLNAPEVDDELNTSLDFGYNAIDP